MHSYAKPSDHAMPLGPQRPIPHAHWDHDVIPETDSEDDGDLMGGVPSFNLLPVVPKRAAHAAPSPLGNYLPPAQQQRQLGTASILPRQGHPTAIPVANDIARSADIAIDHDEDDHLLPSFELLPPKRQSAVTSFTAPPKGPQQPQVHPSGVTLQGAPAAAHHLHPGN